SKENSEISININKEDVLKFWEKQFCSATQLDNPDITKIISKTIKPLNNILEINIKDEMIEALIDKLPNWKATGVDRIYNFFIKSIKSIRKPLIKEIQRLCKTPNQIPDMFFHTLTYMIPKNNNPTDSEFRPISCMSNIYKLITKVLTINLYNILEVNGTISFNQLGVRKNTMASKEQVLFNHSINVIKDFKLKTLWFDIQKAFDSVPFQYLNEILKQHNAPTEYISLMQKLQDSLQLNIIIQNKKVGTIKPKRGII
ncbi:LINE-1 retrotransposable element ORF2 protein, partial [Dictyocoela roeselum]